MKKPYTSAKYEKSVSGFTLLLDGKPARTPAGNTFLIPHEPLAKAITAEWESQSDKLRKDTMPLSQLACVAIDLAKDKRAELMADIVPYGETDLICYRAEDTPALAQQQAALLDPILAWAHERFGVTLNTTGGMMPVQQPPENRQKFVAALDSYDDWKFAALAASVGPLGSLLLGLAFIERRIDAAQAFEFSQLEESFETAKWGRDNEKEARMQKLHGELAGIGRFLSLLLSSGN